MADQVPPNVVSLLKELVGAVIIQQAQIAELQGDRTTLMQASEEIETRIATLQAHAETVVGDSGLTSQLGDLTAVPALHDQLTAALPAPAETPAGAAQAPAAGATSAATEPQAA